MPRRTKTPTIEEREPAAGVEVDLADVVDHRPHELEHHHVGRCDEQHAEDGEREHRAVRARVAEQAAIELQGGGGGGRGARGAGGRAAIRSVSEPLRYNRLSPRSAHARSPRVPCRPAAAKRMSYYQRHVFFCCNKRDPPEACCANHGAAELQAYAKDRDQGARAQRQGQGADQQGRLPRPLRGRAGDRRLSGSGLVHLRRPRGHRRDHRPPRRSAARSSRGYAFDAEDHASGSSIDGPAGALEIVLNAPETRAARHRARRASASAAGRHARQQGRADARQDVLRAGLRERALQLSRRRRVRGARSTTATARPTTRSRRSRMRRPRFGRPLPGRAGRIFVRLIRADARRGERGRGADGAGRPGGWTIRGRRGPGRHDRDPRRGRTTWCRSPTCSLGAAAGAAGRSSFPAAAISSTAGCRSSSA